MVEQGQADLLRLLIDRVPAEIGVGVILGLNTLFASHAKGEDAGRALLATVMSELTPILSHTLLATLADAQASTDVLPYDARASLLRAELLRAVRRLLATNLQPPDRNTLEFIQELLDDE